MVEEAGCQACEKLSPSERVCLEVFSPRESPAPATKLGEFLIRLVVETLRGR
jgi:hypothetical protein